MKYVKYIFISLAAMATLVGCNKHEIGFGEVTPVGDQAMFQVIYIAPKAVTAANAMDSLYVDGKLYGGAKGIGQLAVNGTYPYAGANSTTSGGAGLSGRYFTIPAGNHTITLYQKNQIVYEKPVTLEKGRQKVFVYSLDENPIVIASITPAVSSGRSDVASFDSDSVATIRLYNFVWKDANTPYPDKLQYQWSNNSDGKYLIGDWHNVGEPVGFGEATDVATMIIHKTTFNLNGFQTIRFRCVDANGNFVAKTGDYWTSFFGKAVNHYFRGILGGNPAAGYTQTFEL